jgi:hypothetical protein
VKRYVVAGTRSAATIADGQHAINDMDPFPYFTEYYLRFSTVDSVFNGWSSFARLGRPVEAILP